MQWMWQSPSSQVREYSGVIEVKVDIAMAAYVRLFKSAPGLSLNSSGIPLAVLGSAADESQPGAPRTVKQVVEPGDLSRIVDTG